MRTGRDCCRWSSTTAEPDTVSAWAANFFTGVVFDYTFGKTDGALRRARCEADGEGVPYVDVKDGLPDAIHGRAAASPFDCGARSSAFHIRVAAGLQAGLSGGLKAVAYVHLKKL